MKLTISLAQLQIRLGQPEENLQAARPLIQQAAADGSQIILLPELWTTGYDLPNVRAAAEANRAVLAEIEQEAKRHNIRIGGSVLLEQDGRFYNTFVLHAPDGSETAQYSKIHLFRLMQEDRWLSPGDHVQMVQMPQAAVGLAICYDLRFPELFRKYALAGADLFLMCAEWPLQRIAHWQTLLRARAIENQCFIAAVNSTGETGGETFGGSSAIISPWGEVLVEGTTSRPDLLTATVDMDQVVDIRQRIPIFKDRRPDLYI
jgi:omega-amidase